VTYLTTALSQTRYTNFIFTPPLHLLFLRDIAAPMPCRASDSTGIKAEGEGEWNAP